MEGSHNGIAPVLKTDGHWPSEFESLALFNESKDK